MFPRKSAGSNNAYAAKSKERGAEDMELNELKETWQMIDKALERGNRLSEQILRRQNLDAMQKSLRPLRRSQTFQIFFGIFFILLAALLWTNKPHAPAVIASGVIVQAYGIACVLTAGAGVCTLPLIYYTGPVVGALN